MNYIHKIRKPPKDQFGIFGIQIAGKIMHLNILIKDSFNIHRLYHLSSVEIPIQPTTKKNIFKFIKTLLYLRNIIIINISLLLHSYEIKLERQKRQKRLTKEDYQVVDNIYAAYE